MNRLYIDCKYGISGDMLLSSLVDLGADVDYIKLELSKLPIDLFEMSFQKVNKNGISSNKLILTFPDHHACQPHTHECESKAGKQNAHTHDHHHHHAGQIIKMIEESQLSDKVKENSLKLFKEVARAEGKIHGVDPEKVHFHEVGAMDSIIDTIGVCLAIESLNVGQIIFSRVPTGFGMIEIAHGLYPIPAPATAEILVGVPLSDFAYPDELTTPTGASFAKILADGYEDVPSGEIVKIGYGCGTKNFDHPNILRTILLKKK